MSNKLKKEIVFINSYNRSLRVVDYEVELKKNQKRNEKFMKEFEKWLNEKKLNKKTIRKHLSNADLYINDYLNYYDVVKMEDGITKIFSFFDGWFIRKCLWASKTSLKEMVASIKKFYQCMSEKNRINSQDYQQLCSFLKEHMDYFLEQLEDYNNEIYDDEFDWI